jgi:hypothetical protein
MGAAFAALPSVRNVTKEQSATRFSTRSATLVQMALQPSSPENIDVID